MAWTKVVVQKSLYQGFPQHCASCLALDEFQQVMVTSRTRHLFQDPIAYDAPICSKCATRDRWLSRAGWLLLALSIVAARRVAVHFDLTSWTRDAITIVTLSFAGWVGRRKHPVSVSKKSGQETVTFWFRNEQYAQEFAAMNSAMCEPVLFGPVL